MASCLCAGKIITINIQYYKLEPISYHTAQNVGGRKL